MFGPYWTTSGLRLSHCDTADAFLRVSGRRFNSLGYAVVAAQVLPRAETTPDNQSDRGVRIPQSFLDDGKVLVNPAVHDALQDRPFAVVPMPP